MKSEISICLVAVLGLSTVVAAQELRSNAPDQTRYIASASIKDAGGELRLKTKGGAAYSITSIKSPRGYPGDCLVDRASLEKQVERLGFAGKIGPTGAVIKMKATRSGNQTICSGEGSGCLVVTSDWDPDDPVLPE